MKRELLTFAAASMLGGCATYAQPAPVSITTPFDREAHAPYYLAGTGSIHGQAFLRQQGGGVVTCAGSPVLVVPATAYFREAFSILRTGRPVTGQPAEVQQLGHQSVCDAQGNFHVGNLAAGQWFVTTEVSWTVGYAAQGGGLLTEVTVADGQPTQVLLTDAHRVR